MTARWPPGISRRAEIALVAVIVLLALFLRVVAQHRAPNGWREDELSNALAISPRVREGDIRLYYDYASGHEGLYHWLQTAVLSVVGVNVWGIRGLSITFSTATVLLTYLLARRLFGWPTAAIAALTLAVSFWSLVYARTGQRHVSVLFMTLLSFILLWRGVQSSLSQPTHPPNSTLGSFLLSGLFMGIGFYTYFASRGVPLIVIAWGSYLLVWRRDLWRRLWRSLLATLLVAGLLAVPLIVALRQQPEAEARIAELAKPIDDARIGDFSTLGRYTLTTLSMFTHDGDDEVLYNVPHRPVFGLLGGLLFWIGVVMGVIRALGRHRDERLAFLLLWFAAGLAPGALSVPAASLSHTLLAQPPAMIFPALTLAGAAGWLSQQPAFRQTAAGTLLGAALVFLGWEAIRGPYAYFVVWPADPFNRVLHHSDLHEAADWLNANADTRDLAIGGFLLERWDQQVMKLDLRGDDWRVRAFDPRQAAIFLPDGGIALLPEYLDDGWGVERLGDPILRDAPYSLYRIQPPPALPPIARFANGLALLDTRVETAPDRLSVTLTYRVERPLDLPPFPLFSKPPAPGEDDTPRLAIFVQILDAGGQRLAGADGLGVDPYTLYPGDVFIQQFEIDITSLPPGAYRLVTGLYNPATGQRHADTFTGLDVFDLGVWSPPE